MHSNHLFCDCHLAWLSQWLRQRPTIGLFTQCSGPASLRGLNVAEVQKGEFSCSGGCLCPRPSLAGSSPLFMMSTHNHSLMSFHCHFLSADHLWSMASSPPPPMISLCPLFLHCLSPSVPVSVPSPSTPCLLLLHTPVTPAPPLPPSPSWHPLCFTTAVLVDCFPWLPAWERQNSAPMGNEDTNNAIVTKRNSVHPLVGRVYKGRRPSQ